MIEKLPQTIIGGDDVLLALLWEKLDEVIDILNEADQLKSNERS